jgi:hypothetical protein
MRGPVLPALDVEGPHESRSDEVPEGVRRG